MEDTRSVVTHPYRMRISRILVAALMMISPALFAAPGDLDPAFLPVIPSPAEVRDILTQPDGKVLIHYWVIATTIEDRGKSVLVRFNPDGTLDESFSASADTASVRSVKLIPDGKVLVGGDFNSINGVPHQFLVRLDQNGSIDETFDPHIEVGPLGGGVSHIAVQPDGRIVIAGTFKLRGQDTVRAIARLNVDGSPDNSFEASINASLTEMLLQPDGRLLVTGHITTGMNPPGFWMLRLHPDGSVDPSFALPPATAIPGSFILLPDGKILGAFQQRLFRLETNGNIDPSFLNEPWTAVGIRTLALQPDGAIVATAHDVPLKRFRPDGSLDSTFNATVEPSSVNQIAFDSAGRILVGGGFSSVNGTPRNYLVRLAGGDAPAEGAGVFNMVGSAYAVREATGSATVWVKRTGGNSLPATINYTVSTGNAGSDDFIPASGTLSFAVGETFKAINVAITDDSLVEGYETFLVTLSQPSGGATFGPLNSATVTIFDDEKPGHFVWRKTAVSVIEGQSQLTLEVSRRGETFGPASVRFQIPPGSATIEEDYFLPDGTVTFADGENVKALVIYIANDSLKEGPEQFVLQLTDPSAGAVVDIDSSVSVTIEDDDRPGALAPGFSAATLPSGSGENVQAVVELPDGKILVADSVGQSALRRLNQDGTLDTNFTPQFLEGAFVRQLVVQPDGRILLVGTQLRDSAEIRKDLVRLKADGTLDDSFNPGAPSGNVQSIALQPDSKVVAIGTFTSIGGGSRNYIARLLPDGSLDNQFTVGGAHMDIDVLALQPDGKILVGGDFGMFAGIASHGLVRLHPGGEADDSLKVDPSISASFTRTHAIAVQPDGKILLAGNFPGVDGSGRSLVRLLPDGKLDPSFEAGALPQGWSHMAASFVLLLPDGKIVANGNPRYTELNEMRNIVLRRNPDGSVDPTFETVGFLAGGIAALSKNGDIFLPSVTPFPSSSRLVKVIGGELYKLGAGQFGFGWAGYEANEAAGRTVVHVVRKEGTEGTATVDYATADGSALAGRDYTSQSGTLTFGPGEVAKAIEIPLINTAVVDGSRQFAISLTNPSAASLGTPALTTVTIRDDERPGRFQFSAPTYTMREGDSLVVKVTRTFGADQQATVDYSATSQSASSGADYVLASGTLTFGNGEVEKTFTVQGQIDGALEGDETFSLALANVTGGGELGTPVSAIVTIQDEDDAGSLKSFALLDENSTITASAKSPDGKVMLAGGFVGGINLVRLLPDGSIDGQFNSAVTEGTIRAIAVQGDGKVVIAGSNLRRPGEASRSVVRLNADGTNDPSLDQFTGVTSESGGFLGDLSAVGVQSDGKIILGGIFTTVNGTARPYLARLLTNGSLDLTFQPEVGSNVMDMVVDKDDTILFATRRNKLVRLKPDGAVDPLFQASFSILFGSDQLTPQCIALDSYGRILVGGYFTHVNGEPRLNFARLHPDGTLDTSFDAGSVFETSPDAIEIQEDGRILVGGYYLHPVGGIVRLQEDGALDSTFKMAPVPGTRWDHVATLTVLEQAGLLVSGGFEEIDGKAQKNCALLFLGKRPGTFRFEAGVSSEIAENGGSISVTVKRVGGSEGDAVVEYETESGSALPVNDYVGASGSLVFQAGETTKTFNVSLVDDAKYEQSEQFKVRLSNATGSFLSAISQTHEITIQDNDTRFPGAVQFSVPAITVNEADGVVSITVERVGGVDDLIAVDYATMPGTARGWKDYAECFGTLEFPEGVTSQTIEVPLLDGDLAEESEEFTVVLMNPNFGGSLGSPSSITVTVADEDTGTLNLFRGTYAGILEGETASSNGLIQLTVASRGAVSGFIMLGQKRYAIRGRMNADGELVITIPRRGSTPIELTLSVNVLSPETEQISGVMTNDGYIVEFTADRRTYQTKTNPAAAAGQYSLILSRMSGHISLPPGHGYALVKITKGGVVRIAGKLPDGAAFASSSNLSKDNEWPLHVPLYSKTGSISGVMQLNQVVSWNCSGGPAWFKPARARDKYYPNGFEGGVLAYGEAKPSSGFTIPSGSQVQANLFEGGLDVPLDPLTLELLPKNTLRGSEGLKLSINSATGIITGQFVHPQTHRTVPVRGVLVPNESRAGGFFLGPESGGALELTITLSSAP